MFEREINFDRFIRGVIIVGILIFALYLLNRLHTVLLPFFVAWLLAYMIHPIVKFFQYKLKLRNRLLCIIITLLLITAAIMGFFWLIIPPAISEFMRFRTVIYEFIASTGNSGMTQRVEEFLQQHIDQNTIMQLLREKNVMEAIQVGISQLWSLVSTTLDFIISLLGIFMVLLYLFFILLDYKNLSEGWIKLIPKQSRGFVSELVGDVEHGMNAYFRGQALVALIVGILFSIGFLIIDFPLAIGLGLFIGFLNLVPYMQAFGFIPTVLLALLKAYDTGNNFWFILLGACIVFVVVQTIQDTILVPRIMGKLMGLNPAVILLSLSVWGALLGLIGLIIALPLTTLLLSYYRRFIARDERKIMLTEVRTRQNNAKTKTTEDNVSAPEQE